MNHDTSAPSRPGLVRVLGPLMATAVVVGTTIGSGVFKKAQIVSTNVPNFWWAATAWIAIGVLALLGGLSIAEVASLYPRAGGAYVFLREGYGRLAGFLWGWVEFWIIRSASIAALATIFSESLFNVLRDPALASRLGYSPDIPSLNSANEVYTTLAVIFGLALVNARGVKWGGVLQLFITLVKVGSLLFIIALPFLFTATPVSNPNPLPETWKSPPPSITLGGFASALLAVLWAYHGWMNIAPVAGEIKNPQRNVPLSLIGGVGIIIALYLGANFAYAWIIPQDQMANINDRPVATEFSLRLLGSVGAVLMSAIIMCSVFGALNGNILVGPRVLYAMGDDGLAPRSLGRVHPHYRTPLLAIVVLAGWSMLLVSGVALWRAHPLPTFTLFDTGIDLNLAPEKSAFDVLTDFAMFGVVIFETMAVLSIFVFRRIDAQAERPYRCWGYPLTPILYSLLPALILGNFFVHQRAEAVTAVAIIALGAAVYGVLLRQRPLAKKIV
jgi:APA family basic amino acid/polyamine antiporter